MTRPEPMPGRSQLLTALSARSCWPTRLPPVIPGDQLIQKASAVLPEMWAASTFRLICTNSQCMLTAAWCVHVQIVYQDPSLHNSGSLLAHASWYMSAAALGWSRQWCPSSLACRHSQCVCRRCSRCHTNFDASVVCSSAWVAGLERSTQCNLGMGGDTVLTQLWWLLDPTDSHSEVHENDW